MTDFPLYYTVKVEVTRIVQRPTGQRWLAKADGSPGYEYIPSVMDTKEQTAQVYEQSIEVLDMARLVAVVNDLPIPEPKP